MLRCFFCGYCVDACPEEVIIMSNNYDMAYFTREQSIVCQAKQAEELAARGPAKAARY
jgi:formate hydrogenlyase subunit 6/NADH:ubiquinone oxidoreductase subunit I